MEKLKNRGLIVGDIIVDGYFGINYFIRFYVY